MADLRKLLERAGQTDRARRDRASTIARSTEPGLERGMLPFELGARVIDLETGVEGEIVHGYEVIVDGDTAER